MKYSFFAIIYYIFFNTSQVQGSLQNKNIYQKECIDNWYSEKGVSTQDKIHSLKQEAICTVTKNFKDCVESVIPNIRDIYLDESLLFSIGGITCSNGLRTKIPASAVGLSAKAVQVIIDSGKVQRRYINTLEDFYHHIELHKKRVVILMEEIYKKYPEAFGGLKLEEVVKLASAHDNAKLDAILKGFDAERPHYRNLFDGYGKKLSKEAFAQLNIDDGKIIDDIFKSFDLSPRPGMSPQQLSIIMEKKNSYLRMEKIIDVIDRMTDPVAREEFGVPAYPLRPGNDEKKYAEIIKYLMETDEYGLNPRLTSEAKAAIARGKGEFYSLTPMQRANLYRRIRTTEIMASLRGKVPKKLGIQAAKSLFTGLGRALSSKMVTTGLLAFDVFMLSYYNSLYSLGCPQTGFHDWYKNDDGECRPVMGIGPNFSNFLSLPMENQKEIINSTPHQCRIIEASYKNQNEKKFHNMECFSDGVEVSTDLLQSEQLKYSKNDDGSSILSLKKGIKKWRRRREKGKGRSVNIHYDKDLNPEVICVKYQASKSKNGICHGANETEKFSSSDQKLIDELDNSRRKYSFHLLREYNKCQNFLTP